MKKIGTMMMVALATLLLASCGGNKSTIEQLKGEWLITEANGQAITAEHAFLGFNPEAGYMYGNSGCNNISASFDTKEQAGELDLDDIATTAMLCDNQAEEMTIQNALERVELFTLSEDGNSLQLLSEDKAVVLKLTKISEETMERGEMQNPVAPAAAVTTSDKEALAGSWKVIKVGDLIIAEQELESAPEMTFDLTNMSLSGHLSCNNFSANLKFDEPTEADYDASEIDIDNIISTRMACSNMTVEQALAAALDEVDHFVLVEGEGLVLYDDVTPLIVLERIPNEEK